MTRGRRPTSIRPMKILGIPVPLSRIRHTPKLLASMTLLGLHGCGGVADIPGLMVDALVCGLRNCTESSTLQVQDISPRFTAKILADGGLVFIDGSLGKSANLTTTVLMAPNESLSASVDNGIETPLSNPDGQRLDYTASLRFSSPQPVVRLVFVRAGTRHVSEVTMPPLFSVIQPAGTATLTKTGGPMQVRLSLAAIRNLVLITNGSCTRTDGSTFSITNGGLRPRADTNIGGVYYLDPTSVDTSLNDASSTAGDHNTAKVSLCNLTLTWSVTFKGTIAPTMNQHGYLDGVRETSQSLVYDAR